MCAQSEQYDGFPTSDQGHHLRGESRPHRDGNVNLKLISATGGIEIDTNVGSSGNVVILSTSQSGDSAVMPTRGVVVYGTIYASAGEVRTNGQSFTLNQGRIIARDFRQNGNGGGFTASNVDDPYAQLTYRLVE